MPLQPEPSLTPAPPQPTAVPSAALPGATASDQEDAMHEALLGLVNYKKSKEMGASDEMIFEAARQRLDKQAGLFKGQLNPHVGLQSGFTYRQLLEENDRRMRAADKATLDTPAPQGLLRRGASAAYDFFVPPDPSEKIGDTAGQLLTAPFREGTRAADEAGSAVASKLPLLDPDSAALQYLSAGLGTATALGLDPMNWNPRAALKATEGGHAALEAIQGAAELGKPTMGALGRLANTEVPGALGRGLEGLAGKAEAGGIFSVFDPRDTAATAKDLAALGGAGARGVQRLWEGRSAGMSGADILDDVAKAQGNKQLAPVTLDDLNKYTVREQLARDVSEDAGRAVGADFRPEFMDELRAMRKNPANSEETIKAAGRARLDSGLVLDQPKVPAQFDKGNSVWDPAREQWVDKNTGRSFNELSGSEQDKVMGLNYDDFSGEEISQHIQESNKNWKSFEDAFNSLPEYKGTLSPKQLEETGALPSQLKLEPPGPPSDLRGVKRGGLTPPAPETEKLLQAQQAAKLNPETRVAVANLGEHQEMTQLLQDPEQSQKLASQLLDLPEHKEFPGWARPIPKEAPAGAGLLERTKAGAANLAADTGYALKFPARVAWGTFKQYFADPSATLPRLAAETGRAFEHLAHTRSLFLEHTNAVLKTLRGDERLAVAAMLDSRPEEWASNAQLAQYLQGPAREKVLAGYRDLRRMLNKLADVEGLEPHQRVTDYFPHIGADEYIKRNPTGMSVPDLGIYSQTTENRFHLPREGMQQYNMDLADVLNVRISIGLRKAYLNPVIKAFEPRFVELPRQAQDYADLYIRRLQGRPGPIHEELDKWIRTVTKNSYNAGDLTRAQVFTTMMYYRGLLGGALDTAFKNLSQVQNTFAEVGLKNTLRGAQNFFSRRGQQVMAKAGVGQDYEKIIEASGNLHSSFWGVADKALFMPMRFSEYINRGVAFHGGLIQAYEKGLQGDQAVNFAKHVVDKTQFRYGVTNTSPYLQNPLGKLLYQFGSYPVKELQFMEELLKDPDKAKITRMLLLHGFVYGAAKVTGSSFNEAFGQEEWTVPLTGNKRLGKKPLTVPLPTSMITHFLNFTSPAVKLLSTAGLALATDVREQNWQGRNVKSAEEQALNLVPAHRYGKKLWEIYGKIDQGYEKGRNSVETYGIGKGVAEAVGARQPLQ